MADQLAFPAKTDPAVDLRGLAYVDNPEPDRWIFAGPYGIPFVLQLTRVPRGVDEASLSVPTLRLHNWDGAPQLSISCDTRGILIYLPKDFDYPEDTEDLAYAIINLMAEKLQLEAVRTVRGTFEDMKELLQSLANLTGRGFRITCAPDEHGPIGVTSSNSDIIQNTAQLIALFFTPIGTSPASIQNDYVDRRQPTVLPLIEPAGELTGHQRIKDTARVQSFLEENMKDLGLTPAKLKRRLRAIGIE